MSDIHDAPTEGGDKLEVRRAMLRAALQKQPHDLRMRQALKRSLKPMYVRHAAERGVFICYTRSDELLAFELVQALHTAGISAWMDELNIPEEGDWDQNVGHALRNCGVLLLLLSPRALQDEAVTEEYHYFWQAGKIILPVMAAECDVRHLNLFMDPIPMHTQPEVSLRVIKNYLHIPAQASVS